MALFFETKKFKREHAKWMRRLEKEGFDDIERGNHRATIVQDLSQKVHFKAEVVASTEAYYSWAVSVMHGKRFRNSRFMRVAPRRRVWRMHAQGKNNSEIGRAVGLSRWTIEDLVKRIRSFLSRK